MKLLFGIALKHLLARKRQSIVSLLGIILGVAFFLAISSLMKGSENDFLKRLVDNSPHITVNDEFRNAREQPAEILYKGTALEMRNVKPLTETRGIRGYKQIMEKLGSMEGLKASPVLGGNALTSFAGKDQSISLSGMDPQKMFEVTTIANYMVAGKLENLLANADGVIIGEGLAQKLSLSLGNTITVSSPAGQVRAFKIVGIFRTGRKNYDESQAFVDIKRAQAFFGKVGKASSIIIKLPDAYTAREVAATIEGETSYKSVSWQEASEDIMNTLAVRNTITYTIVSAVLVVAAFGIYNVISTVVMEKQRDIAILKSMGFHAADIQKIFLVQGALLGLTGCATGLPLGCGLMLLLMQIRFKPPGSSEVISMPLDWGWAQFAVAGAFAMTAAMLAAFLPAQKAAKVKPVDILRGSA